VTLFDHIDDDEFDGDLGENDSELPRIKVHYQIKSMKPKSREQSFRVPKGKVPSRQTSSTGNLDD
jgi:hypothetical protein